MFIKSVTALAVSAATIIAAPVLAAPGGGNGGGGSHGAGGMAGANAGQMGAMHASPNSSLNRTTTTTNTTLGTSYNQNSPAAQNSQALQHASPTGIAHANQKSVLARGAVSTSTLSGLTTGLTVNDSGGTSIGTVSQVIAGPNDTIRAIVVTSSTGQTYTLSANSLTISGGVVTTTSTTVP